MIRIGLLGYSGRMGQALAKEIGKNKELLLSSGLVREMKPEYKTDTAPFITTDLDEVIAKSDVVIDFTLADRVASNAEHVAKQKKAYMCGVTGLDAATLKVLKNVSSQIPVLYAPNTSLSLAAMKQITALAAKLLKNFDYEISILDEHHSLKKDAPSGTAKALGEAVLEGNGYSKEPAYAAIRSGHIIGNHEVSFNGSGETIRLHHSVTDRAIFAEGATQAAFWVYGKPKGFYSMEDVLGLKKLDF